MSAFLSQLVNASVTAVVSLFIDNITKEFVASGQSPVQNDSFHNNQFVTRTGGRRFGLQLLLLFTLLLGSAFSAQAGEFCSIFPDPNDPSNGLIDGDDPVTVQFFIDNNVTQITIDTNCTFRNWDPLEVTINFQTPGSEGKPIYLIVFDNVNYTGNMACANIDHKIWMVNGSRNDFSSKCQDLFIPVEAISKKVPAGKTTVGIGEPFTYTLTIPVLYDPALGTVISNTGTDVPIGNIVVTDDLSFSAIGVNLSLVSTSVTYNGSPLAHTFTNSSDVLTFEIDPSVTIPAGDQFEIEITLVPDATNVVGTQFFNTASWNFSRSILLDLDGDGILEPKLFDPLPGENGISETLTIGAPELTVTKTSQDAALNIGVPGTFNIDVQNTGNSDAWSPTIIDALPDTSFPGPTVAGMCDVIPSNITVGLYEADGMTLVTNQPALGDDYTLNFVAPSVSSPQPNPSNENCDLTIQLDSNGSNNIVIAPNQRLIITYTAELDGDTDADGVDLINIAAATQWYSADPGGTAFVTFNPGIDSADPGTPGIVDNQDTHTITTGLSGYFFTKSVENQSTGDFPATTAASGDTLRYTLRIFNVDQTITAITVTDDLTSAQFNQATFNEVSTLGVLTSDFTGGVLTLTGNDLTMLGDEFVYVFDIQLASGLLSGDIVSNQASLDAQGVIDGEPGDPAAIAYSDNPFINSIDDPQVNPPNPDPTDVLIQQPGPLLKTGGPATATIGDEITYRITVPQTAVSTPLYDVRILDDLTANGADLEFVSANVVSGGSWTLTNTGTASDMVLEDTGSGIDILPGGQAVIDITVRVSNTVDNDIGNTFTNTASYTYNRINGLVGAPNVGSGTSTAATTTITESNLSAFSKTVDILAPTAGQTIRYTISLTAQSGTNLNDVFDVIVADNLDLGLVYAGNPTVTTGIAGGSGVADDNSILDPDVSGDGINTPQILVWGTAEANIDIDAGETVAIAYDVLVLDSVLANQTLTNSAIIQWTGTDGENSNERTGIDGAGVEPNDYATAPQAVSVTTPDINTIITKVRSSDTYGAGDDNVRIGDVVEYTLRIPIDEGTLGNLQLVDTLPKGLDFLGVVSINGNTGPSPYTAVAPFTHADILDANIVEAGDPANDPTTTVTWDLGNVTNQPNDGSKDIFVIVYRAQVLNNDVLTQINSTALNNTVVMSYDTASSTVTVADTNTIINVLQPNLAVNKSASPSNGDIFIDAAEVVTYTINIVNSGAAPAYDLVLEDIIPAGLRTAGVTNTGITRHTTSTDALVATLTSFNPANLGAGVVQWNFDSGTADEYTIPPDETLRVVYTVQADAGIAQGQILTNAATATLYYSFDDEALPSGAAANDREIYGPSNTATTTLYTSAPPVKTLITPAPGAPEATIGEDIIYQITVPGTVSSSTLYDVNITDALDANLVHIIADTTITGGSGITNNSTANALDVDIAQITAGTQVVIELHTRLSNVLSAQQGVDINNTVAYTYAFTSGGPTQPVSNSTNVVVNIVEPNIGAISKLADNMTPTAGETVRYSVQLAATGGTDNSDVFDVTITDTMDLGLVYQGSPTVSVGASVSADNSIGAPIITGDGVTNPQTLVWSLANGNADIDIVEGTTVTIAFDVLVDDSVLSDQMLNNSVTAQWTGIDGGSGFERDGSDGIGGLNDYITPSATVALNLPGINTTISKVRSSDTFGTGDDDVRIGDIVEYSLTVPMPEGTLGNLQLVDSLPQGMEFVDVVSINGNTGPAPFSQVAPFSHVAISNPTVSGDPATAAGSALSWSLGDVTNLPVDNAPNDFVIVYRARVLDNVFTQVNNTPLNNTVTMTYDTAGGTVTTSDLTTPIALRQPNLAVGKTENDADNVIAASETVDYIVLVTNSGDGPAYDPVIVDTLPIGMRAGGITVNSVQISGAPVADISDLAIVYNSNTGIATIDFSAATKYTVPANGGTLQIVYTATADADLAAGLTLSNAAVAQTYYSFDDNATPEGTTDTREIYGPSNIASTTLNSPIPGVMLKQTPFELSANPDDQTVTIGEIFTYRIAVPETPVNIALHDVRVTDTLNFADIGADLSLVSFVASGTFSGTPVNSGTATSVVIEDATNGIDIPANGQLVLDITVEVVDSSNNVSGNIFNNIANWTYNQLSDGSGPTQTGLGDTSGDMTIIGPDTLTLVKSGPAMMRIGVPGDFQLNLHNDNTSGNSAPAWDMTITDQLPNLAPGGMCDTAPDNFVAGIYQNDGTTLVTTLTENSDYTVSFDTPSCLLVITMTSTNAMLPVDNRLIIDYQAHLDSDTLPNTLLTNIAGVTEWFSNDTAGVGATGATRTFTEVLSTDPAVASATLDHEDAVTVSSEAPVISVQKAVANRTTGGPGDAASPGDTLRYSITIQNVSSVDLPNFSFIDDLGALNTDLVFVSGTLNLVTVPAGAIDNSNASAGANGAGLVTLDDLSLGASGSATDTVLIEFDVTLVPVITSGTVVLNQGQLEAPSSGVSQVSNDPVVNPTEDPATIGDEVPTETTITSAPAFIIEKTSQDVTGDSAVLDPGDTLRYTLTVQNIGDENTINTLLSDQIPSNTAYVAGSTTLNTVVVVDPSAGVSALAAGMLINAPENATAGFMQAVDVNDNTNVATITFDVVVNLSAIGGTVISNQGFVSGDGAGSGTFPQQPSNDPDTAAVDDPTIDVVGNLPLFDVQKTVAIAVDGTTVGVVDPGDVLRYTITATNLGSIPITNAVLTDMVPTDTSFVTNSVFLNGLLVADTGVSPLIAGIDISSSDLTPPLPLAGAGILSPGQSAVVTFDVVVGTVAVPMPAAGTLISNQGFVSNNELPTEPTDADGVDANGDQPTVVTVGSAPSILITKQVSVVGGGTALPGSQLEYIVRVTNTGLVPVTNVVIDDDLLPVASQMTYVANSGLLNGLPTGVSFAASVLTADLSLTPSMGIMAPDAVAELRFRVLLAPTLGIGEVVSNTGVVTWNASADTASATVDISIGGTPGAANVNGQVWHDADFSNDVGANEVLLQDWRVELYRNNVLLSSALTDVNGSFQFSGLSPNLPTGDAYELRYFAPGAAANTASLGTASSAFTNLPQQITDIFAASGASIQNLNLPRQANGVVYDSVLRVPVAGVRLTMLNQTRSNVEISEDCFADTKHQNQVTLAGGYYKFDLDFSEADCAETDEYVIQVQPPITGYIGTTSVIIPPVVPITGTAQNVPACLSDGRDKITATASHCENSGSDAQAPTSVAPREAETDYNLKFIFDSAFSTNQIYNNHIPVDSELEAAVAISKVAGLLNVTRSQLVPYTITFTNTLGVRLFDINIIDNFPAGFKYVEGSASVDGVAVEPAVNGRQLTWSGMDVDVNESSIIKLLLIVGSGVGEGEYINTAQAINVFTGDAVSGVASATVKVIPDPSFDCSDIIGKVYDDANMNMYQDDGEVGLAGVQLATARGLRVTTDSDGRFHITCAVVPNEIRGSNFIIKLDERTLPSGYRVTTENPRVQRATRGKMLKFNFGAAIHRIVRLDLANGVFEKGSTELRPQWRSRIDMLIIELQKDPSILRLSYLGENETESEVDDRLDVIEYLISDRWEQLNCCYKLTIEKEVFWRKGNPSDRMTFD